MGKSPKLFYYGHRPGARFGIFGGPTLISEGPLPKPQRCTLQGLGADIEIGPGLILTMVFRQQRMMVGCKTLPAVENPLPSSGPLPHYGFYQEGRFLVFLYNGKRVWAIRSELSVIRW
jgi:hypothetical protein